MKILNFSCPPLPHFVVAGRATYGSNNVHPTRNNVGVFDLIFVVEGQLNIIENDDEYTIKREQYLILSPDTYHVGHKASKQPTKFYWLHFQTRGNYILSDDINQITPMDIMIHVHSFHPESPFNIAIPKFGTVKHVLASELETYLQVLATIHVDLDNDKIDIDKLSISNLHQQNTFINILDLLALSDSECPPDIPTMVTKYIKANFQKNFKLKDMANELNFHPNYITRVMKDQLSITPKELLMTYRINYAKYLISHEHFSIKKIAKESGFNSPAYFSKVFKAHTQMLPTEYAAKMWN